ncbi:sulfatase-like hydrolase/transferase [Candidatus Regiella insecticola]|nr:sulfatase-like hydrolase/transferase [Candidatus Regiella insecticola]
MIGESATRDRMSIFGYKRKTTPYAEEDKSTIIYKNNTTNGINTQPNVRTLLTGDVPSDKKEINQNLFQVTRMANFHTYVVDNNTFKSKDPLYIIKSQSDLYINMNGVGQDSHGNTKKIKFDEFALKKIEQLINSKKQGNNIYLLHLMGSHPLQNDKYPEEFNKFRSYYDNSILYSDYIIHKSKNTLFLANEKKSAIVIYIADHGVGLPHLPNGEVADNEFKSFGANDRNITNFHPPLLIWVNNTFIKNNYKEYKNLIKNTTSPINQRFLLYSISQLIGVESINKIQTKNFSIFSEESNFEPLLYTNEKKQMK